MLPEPVERMAGGMYQWRGGEGSITDRPMEDQCRPGPVDGECDVTANEHDFAADTRPSTGLIYMRARYYDPAVGRFTQADPASYGPEMFWGQNNRWTYCANDPVNHTDPTGHLLVLIGVIGIILGIFGLIFRRVSSENLDAALATDDPCIKEGYCQLAKRDQNIGNALTGGGFVLSLVGGGAVKKAVTCFFKRQINNAFDDIIMAAILDIMRYVPK